MSVSNRQSVDVIKVNEAINETENSFNLNLLEIDLKQIQSEIANEKAKCQLLLKEISQYKSLSDRELQLKMDKISKQYSYDTKSLKMVKKLSQENNKLRDKKRKAEKEYELKYQQSKDDIRDEEILKTSILVEVAEVDKEKEFKNAYLNNHNEINRVRSNFRKQIKDISKEITIINKEYELLLDQKVQLLKENANGDIDKAEIELKEELFALEKKYFSHIKKRKQLENNYNHLFGIPYVMGIINHSDETFLYFPTPEIVEFNDEDFDYTFELDCFLINPGCYDIFSQIEYKLDKLEENNNLIIMSYGISSLQKIQQYTSIDYTESSFTMLILNKLWSKYSVENGNVQIKFLGFYIYNEKYSDLTDLSLKPLEEMTSNVINIDVFPSQLEKIMSKFMEMKPEIAMYSSMVMEFTIYRKNVLINTVSLINLPGAESIDLELYEEEEIVINSVESLTAVEKYFIELSNGTHDEFEKSEICKYIINLNTENAILIFLIHLSESRNFFNEINGSLLFASKLRNIYFKSPKLDDLYGIKVGLNQTEIPEKLFTCDCFYEVSPFSE